VNLCGEAFSIRIYEPCLRHDRALTSEEKERKNKGLWVSSHKWEYEASGQLCLQLRSYGLVLKQFRDGVKRRLESSLNDFIWSLLWRLQCDKANRAQLERKLEKDREAEHEMLAIEEERRRKQARIQDLLREVRSWRQSIEIRSYIAEIRGVEAEYGRHIEPEGELARWLRWAEEVADHLRPARLGQS
jgi:hypothetical protein